MPALWSHLRTHAWQRRLLTGSLALLLGAALAVLALPHVQDYLLLRDLASPSAAVRGRAISRTVQRAAESPRTLRRLEAALERADDTQFAAIVSVLKWLGQFNRPGRDPLHVDRVRAMELAGNPSAETREIFLGEVLRSGRDNRYVRKVLASAARDQDPLVRALSAALAVRLGDEAALRGLLADADANVAAGAALDAGIARRGLDAATLRERLAAWHDVPRRSAAAYALARIDPNAGAEIIPPLLAEADANGPAALRDRLLHVLCELTGPRAERAVLDVLERARRAGRHPPAMALLAAGKLRVRAAAPAVRKVLADAVRPNSRVRITQALAAIQAAQALDIPVRKEVEAICGKLWSTRVNSRLMLAAAARMLGRQATAPQGDRPDEPSPAECVRTLRLAAIYDYVPPTTAPTATKPKPVPSPLPSAAAAVAMWHLKTPLADEFLRHSAGESVTLPGDYVSWHLGVTGEQRAFELGLSLVPPINAAPPQRVYNDDMRATGAMLLAIAARTPEQRAAATQRIRSRLVGGDLGGEDNFHVRGAYECALAILGDAARLTRVVGLLETGQFSQRRAITALTLAGTPRGLDWLLWNPQIGPEDALFLLVDEQIGDVLAACTPQLPRVDAAAADDLAAWQLLILRHTYAISHSSIRPRLRPR